jgi:hypothetical protein
MGIPSQTYEEHAGSSEKLARQPNTQCLADGARIGRAHALARKKPSDVRAHKYSENRALMSEPMATIVTVPALQRRSLHW